MEIGTYYDLQTNRLSSPALEVEFLAEAGPRLVRLKIRGSETNLLAEVPDKKWETPYGDYYIRGGHRLWHSPEAFPRSYMPDNEGLRVEKIEDGARLIGPTEPETHIRKSLLIRLDPDRPRLTLDHSLLNEGVWPVRLAPWAITQFPLGGTAILPQNQEPEDPDGLWPNRHLVLWPYTRWGDDRLELHDDLILLHGRAEMPPCKFGYANKHGWAAYLFHESLVIKHFPFSPLHEFPDFGCSCECYCNDRFLEIESLGPLSTLEPGETSEHREVWDILPAPGAAPTAHALRDLIASLHLP